MRILVVDDDPDIRLVVSVVLSREPGWEVREADGVEAGVRMGLEEPPDVVLLDLFLGDASGLEVLERLGAEPSTRDVPVIFLTGKDARRDELLERGAAGVVSKPFDPGALAGMVRSVLEPTP